MPVIKTKNNQVVACEADEDDLFCQVMWLGPSELHGGRHAKQFLGPLEPMENYQAAVDWAVSMADFMRFPIYVLPMRGREALASEECQRGAGKLTGQQRGELRRLVVATMAEVMRDSGDGRIRADAYDVLKDMGWVRP